MATLKDVMDLTRVDGESLADFRKQWEALDAKDKEELKAWAEEAIVNKK